MAGVLSAEEKRDWDDNELAAFLRTYDTIRDDYIQSLRTKTGCDDLCDWVGNMMDYNSRGGKNVRGLTVVVTFRHLAPPHLVTEENLELARILGWLIELSNYTFMLADDIMDKSEMRRGKICWYLLPNVGFNAINDAFILEQILYEVIDRYFIDHPGYNKIYQYIHATLRHTYYGQALDALTTPPGGRPNMSKLNMERFSKITYYKTTYYTFVAPIGLGMLLAGITDPQVELAIQPILITMGDWIQAQNDYLDCYGDVSVVGKEGTDIEEGKCSWFVIVALDLANDQQRHLLIEHYGRPEKQSIAIVKKVYADLNMMERFLKYESDTYEQMLRKTRETCDKLKISPRFLISLIKRLYRRAK